MVVFACFGGLYLVMAPHAARDKGGPPGFEELVPCAFLTSIDSTKSLYLSGHHEARLSVTMDNGTNWATGTWALVDDDDHTYTVSIDGVDTTYTLVSAPEGEGCMLVAGDLAAADLTKSWFSSLQDPK
jgi:hypothetical protein